MATGPDCYTRGRRPIRVSQTLCVWSGHFVKAPALELRAFLFRNNPESSALWRNYQLSVTPKFYGVLCLLLAIATVRNLVGDAAVAPTLLLTALIGATTA